MSSRPSNSPPRNQSRMTAATEAGLIIAQEYMDRVAEKAATRRPVWTTTLPSFGPETVVPGNDRFGGTIRRCPSVQ
jgi:hypothetical protein